MFLIFLEAIAGVESIYTKRFFLVLIIAVDIFKRQRFIVVASAL